MKTFCFLLLVCAFCLQRLYPFSFDKARIEQHISQKFAEATVETDPFPHLIIENILPEDLYEALVANWPDPIFSDITKEEEGLKYDKNIWREFFRIVDQIIKVKVGNVFREYSHYRFGTKVNGIRLCNSKSLRDHHICEALYLEPHIDHGSTFAPVIIYFPATKRDEQIDQGTCFYRHKGGVCSLDKLSEFALSQVELVKAAPYKRNTLCTFMQTPFSWHSSPLTKAKTRRTYISNIYLSNLFSKSYYGHVWNLAENFLDEENSY